LLTIGFVALPYQAAISDRYVCSGIKQRLSGLFGAALSTQTGH
jgi:hypothetical protein